MTETPAKTRRLILIKHAETLLTPEVTAEHWPLTPHGRAQCAALAERLRDRESRLVASTELKAIETGQLLAKHLGLPFETEIGLHEHDRSNVPLVPREEFEKHMQRFFATPHEVVYGRESAAEAQRRFTTALTSVLRQHPGETPGIVTHGTVLALRLAAHNGQDPFALWKTLGTPCFTTVNLATGRLLGPIEQISVP